MFLYMYIFICFINYTWVVAPRHTLFEDLIRSQLQSTDHRSTRFKLHIEIQNHSSKESSTSFFMQMKKVKVVRNKILEKLLLPYIMELFETNGISHFSPFYDDFVP